MSEGKKTLGVYIGRFQFWHKGHQSILDRMVKECDDILILIGSANVSPRLKNPLSAIHRERLIRYANRSLSLTNSLRIYQINDKISDADWIEQVDDIVINHGEEDDDDNRNVRLYGHNKDESSRYLKWFPEWEIVHCDNHGGINATDIREAIYNGDMISWKDKVHPDVYDVIVNDMIYINAFSRMREEYTAIKEYQKHYEKLPFPPIFMTVDSVVVCDEEYILMVKRNGVIGRGLWALPGGFLNADESIMTGVIRELVEETNIDVSDEELLKCITYDYIEDSVGRSQLGRCLSFVARFDIQKNGDWMPATEAADDASETRWFTLDEINNDGHLIFEDHQKIIARVFNK